MSAICRDGLKSVVYSLPGLTIGQLGIEKIRFFTLEKTESSGELLVSLC